LDCLIVHGIVAVGNRLADEFALADLAAPIDDCEFCSATLIEGLQPIEFLDTIDELVHTSRSWREIHMCSEVRNQTIIV